MTFLRNSPECKWMITVCLLLISVEFLQAEDYRGDFTADPRDFQGYWKIEEPAGDTCYLIIKAGGQASCFWAGNAMDEILKGKWTIRDGRLVITWDSGYRYALEKKGSRTVFRHTYPPGVDLGDQAESTVVGTQYDKRYVGYLAVEDANQNEEREDAFAFESASTTERKAPKEVDSKTSPFTRSQFLGYWYVESKQSALWGLFGAANSYYINVSRDGRVHSILNQKNAGLYGYWVQEGDALKVFWDDGKKQLIRKTGTDFEILTYSEKDDFTDSPDGRQKLVKMDPMDAKAVFQDMAMKFISVEDIVGYWLGESAEIETSPTIEIQRWGHARYFPYGINSKALDAEWQMHSDEVIVKVENGKRFLLINQIDNSWKLEAYNPNTSMTDLADRGNSVRRLKPEEVDRITLRNQQAASRNIDG